MALHGGAGPKRKEDHTAECAHLRDLLEGGRDRLADGASACEVVVETVSALEASGLYVAGRGSSPNRQGRYELDACLADGAAAKAGAVAALEGFESPIRVAQAVMRDSSHVLLAGEGAALFARERGLAAIVDPKSFFTHAVHGPRDDPRSDHGTVGCIVLDGEGRLAAGTSTGGVFGKLPGRVGDSPILGAGTWADRTVAVSCTGQGEYFLRVAAAAQLAMRMRFAGMGLDEAAQAVLGEVVALGGEGGLIALAADGTIAMPFVAQGMLRGALHPDGRIEVGAF